jgi:hypothetical protein
MTVTQQSLHKRLRYILHRGFTEVRNLAFAGRHEQISELADALEILPRYLGECSDEDLDMIRFVLRNYDLKFAQSSYRYLEILDGPEDPPDHY